MYETQILLWLVPGLPLLSAILTALLGPRFLKQQSHILTVAAFGGSCVISLMLLAGFHVLESDPILRADAGTWFASGLHSGRSALKATDLVVTFTLEADTLTVIMLTAITFVGTCIAVFS